MSSGFPDSPFWDFSLAVYGTEGVPPACLALQQRYGADVNLLLWCLWTGDAEGRALTGADLEAVSTRIQAWHEEVVRGLRQVRQRMKDGFEGFDDALRQSLRARVQKLEIDTEHLEQIALWQAGAALGPAAGERGAGAANARLYLESLGAAMDLADQDALAVITSAARANTDRD